MTEKKYFPIHSATACQLKWAWSTVILQTATTKSCHRVDQHSFDLESFNFHNTPEKLWQRNEMLQGNWPGYGCEYCKDIEDTGIGQSDRQFFLDIPNLSPTELFENQTLTNVNPTILELYIDNACNLGCIYCIPELSSRVDFEYNKFGPFKSNGLVLESKFKKRENYNQTVEKFWQWFKQNSNTLVRLHILGGEPFYQKQFDTFLDYFENNPCPNLEFNIVTNLMLSHSKLIDYCNKFKNLLIYRKLKTVEITVSIDCYGPQQEYVRFGLDLVRWEENFNYLLTQKWVKLNINGTISALTIKTMPELISKLNTWTKDRKIEHYFSLVYDVEYLHPSIFGPDEFSEDFQTILSLMENDTWRGKHAKEYMQGIVALLSQSVYNEYEVKRLITFLNENDRRKGTNWHDLFPWLEKYVV